MQSLAPVYVWEPPASNIAVHLNLDFVARLAATVRQAGRGGAARPEEIGGVLLGVAQAGERPVVVVEDFEPVPCEHVRGASFTLSGNDRKALEQRLRRGGRNLSVVGYCRSHTRPGLYLDQDDFTVIDTFFAHPAQICLLVRPGPAGLVGGIFFWEEGDMRRQSSYREFPFDPNQLLTGGHPVCKRSEHWVPATPERTVIPAASSPLPAFLRNLHFPRQPRLVILLIAVVFLIASFMAIRRPTQAPAKTAPRAGFSLRVDRSGDGLRLSWDNNAPAIRSALAGFVHIRDDGSDYRLDLPARQLAAGSVMYFPTGSDVSFEMEVRGKSGKSTEIVRTFAPAPAVPTPQPADVLAQFPPALPTPEPIPETPQRVTRRQSAHRAMDGGTPRRRFELHPQPSRPATTAALAPPPALSPMPVASTQLPGILRERQQQEATVIQGRATPAISPIRKLPALLRLQRSQEAAVKGFVPPRPVRQVRPVIPTGIAGVPPKVISLAVKVRLDESGKVIATETVESNAPPLVDKVVAGAAREWRFAPALMNGKAVASQTVLYFRFEP